MPAKYIEIGKLAIKEINIALHERLTIAKKREKNVINMVKPIATEINIPTLNTSFFYYYKMFFPKNKEFSVLLL